MSESVGWVEWARSYVTQERIQNALGWAQQNVPEYEALKSAASKTMSGQISMQPSTSTQGQTWSAWAWDMASPYVPGNRPPPGPPAVATNPEPIDSFQRYIPLLAHYWYISIPAGLWLVSTLLSWMWWIGAIGVVVGILVHKIHPAPIPASTEVKQS